jgi:hypothetical protein
MMHKQFEAWLAKSQQLDSRNFENWQRASIKAALYRAWKAGRRYQDRFREEQLIANNAGNAYAIHAENLKRNEEFRIWLASAEFPE